MYSRCNQLACVSSVVCFLGFYFTVSISYAFCISIIISTPP